MFMNVKPVVAGLIVALSPLAAIADDAATADTTETAETPQADPDTVVATVNGTDITLGHMIALRAGLPPQFSQVPAEVLFTGILDQIIQQELMMQTMEGEISRAGRLALENEERAVAASQELGRVTEGAVSPAKLREAFEARYLGGEDETEYRASHILVETEEEAASLVTELEGGADFAELAKTHSTGPSGPGGGALGWFSAGMMVEPFQDAVEKLETGEVPGPVQTQFGWHVIKLDETRVKDRPEMDDVRDELEEELRQEAIATHVEGLMAGAEIDRAGAEGIDPAVLDQYDLLQE